MKGSLKGRVSVKVTALFIAALFLLLPAVTWALVSYKSLGIVEKTMQVEDPSKLKAMGMKDVKKGDRITVTGTEDKRFQFQNGRTGERFIYPDTVPVPGKAR